MVERVGHGIFGWNGKERRTDRYGAFVLGERPFDGNREAAAYLDIPALKELVGKRVHITCVAVKTRKSGHVGDLFHKIHPTTPAVGEVVDLGIGVLHLDNAGYEGRLAVVLEPGDGRLKFWMDPHKLYRLHDQTVDLFVEPTEEDFTPAPNLTAQGKEAVDNGDGSFQVKGMKDGERFTIPGTITKLGAGMFVLDPASGREKGKRRKIIPS